MSDDLSLLRHSLKQCEKSVADAQANPRYWEQAAGNYEGLSAKLSPLPADERAQWKQKLQQWKTPIEEGIRQVRGERMLRQINDTLAGAAEQVAGNGDASREFERLERDLSDGEVIRCLPAAEIKRIAGDLQRLQATAADSFSDARAAQLDEHLKHVESELIELASWLKQNPGGQNNSLARTISGSLDSAELELAKLPASHPQQAKQDKWLKKLKQKFAAT